MNGGWLGRSQPLILCPLHPYKLPPNASPIQEEAKRNGKREL